MNTWLFAGPTRVYLGQETGSMSSYGHQAAPTDLSHLYARGFAERGSPPWWDDDKTGHYVFEFGENLTSRCNFIFSS